MKLELGDIVLGTLLVSACLALINLIIYLSLHLWGIV